MSIQQIPLDLLDPHPDNPRLELQANVVAGIRAQLQRTSYDDAHAIIVRPMGDRYQILAGHHRVEAARAESLLMIPAWVREYSDAEAHMQLMLSNVEAPPRPIERGRHVSDALEKYAKTNGKASIVAYARALYGEKCDENKVQLILESLWAWQVYKENQHVLVSHKYEYYKQLVKIHRAKGYWPELCQRLVAEEWTVKQTARAVKKLLPNKARRNRAKIGTEPVSITSISLTEWKEMSADQKADALNWEGRAYRYDFNEQKTDDVEWAKWTHNPVTGCLHNCPYCYAREIAERIYPEKFEPVLHIDRLCAPRIARVPAVAKKDISYKNVFTCSMADLFGNWVPAEWIEAVLKTVRDNPQWNFLFLTKFPIRMAEFEYPDNAWLGTTVDLQARVKNAERAMEKVKAKVKWLSLEPLIEELHFENLSAFKWVVIGGATPIKRASTGPTPKWQPPREWVWDLSLQAHRAGCLVYHKTNLTSICVHGNQERVKGFPGDPNAKSEPVVAPKVFHYLKVIE